MWVAQDQTGRLNKTRNRTSVFWLTFLCIAGKTILSPFLFFKITSTDYCQSKLPNGVLSLPTGQSSQEPDNRYFPQILMEQKVAEFPSPLKGLITNSPFQTCSD